MSDHGTTHKPSHHEDEFFAREDVEKRRKLAQTMKKEMAEEDRKKLRDLHFMHCPKCGMKMEAMTFRNIGVEVCFSCHGVFLEQPDIDVIAHPEQKGIMGAILNWFKDETHPPGK
jgi:Zn-finger nucleic acid-binding protein